MQEDISQIYHILDFLEIEDRKLTKITRIGKFDPDKGPRTILFNTESSISKNLILKSTHKLKDFDDLRVFISSELTKEEAEKENNCLKKRRELISNGIEAKILRVRNLTLEVKENGNWVKFETSQVAKPEDKGTTADEPTKPE